MDHSGLDGEIVQVPIPPSSPPTATRCAEAPHYPYPVAIRPTRDSTDQDIAHYLHVVSSICEEAWTRLVAEKVLRANDIVRIVPVDGCYAGRPPEPRVTLSEVIAVILEPTLLMCWDAEGVTNQKIWKIIRTIQFESCNARSSRIFRTYVLVYSAGTLSNSAQGKPQNCLIAVNFDLGRLPIDVSKEQFERNQLLSVLDVIFSPVSVGEAVSRGTVELSAPISDGSPPQIPVMKLTKVSPFAKVVVILGSISVLLIAVSIFALLSGIVPDSRQGIVAALGVASGTALMFFGELAGQIFEPSVE